MANKDRKKKSGSSARVDGDCRHVVGRHTIVIPAGRALPGSSLEI